MFWRSDQLALVERAVSDAAAGRPTLLSIEGTPGQGKSALLRELRAQARAFSSLAAEGIEAWSGTPYVTLRHWPLDRPVSGSTAPFQAAQEVRVLVDRLAHHGPVLITIDDLQWCDTETVETIAWMLGRAAGDRLLVAAATRPLQPPLHPVWRRLLLDDRTMRIRLDGLHRAEAIGLLQELSPGLESALADRLIEHTNGNPLYLRAMLAEHGTAELAAMSELPPPDDLVGGIATQLDALPSGAADLVRAIAVLGDQWSPLSLAGRLAQVPDASDLADIAAAGALIDRRSAMGLPEVRIGHAVIRSAVEASMPQSHRRELHAAAAELATTEDVAMRHRIAASDGYDDELADDLGAFAHRLHDDGAYREAGRFSMWASASTADPACRESRWLDGLFEHVLARDDELVERALDDVSWSRDVVRRALVTAGLAILTRRWLDARRILEAIDDQVLQRSDERSRYRVVVLRGWAVMITGGSGTAVTADLTWALAVQHRDPAIYLYLAFALGLVRLETAGRAGSWQIADAAPPAAATSASDVTRAAWRGAVYAIGGRFDDGIDILRDVTARARDGLVGFSDGSFHAYLGYAYWMRGDWTRATRTITLAAESRLGEEHPMVAATIALLSLTRNDPRGALEAVRKTGTVLRAAPLPAAIRVAAQSSVVAARLLNDAGLQARLLSQLRGVYGRRLVDATGRTTPVWLVHLALAGLWADELDLIDPIPADLRARTDLGWPAAAADWIDGLVAERFGDRSRALQSLTSAAVGGLDELPLYRALLADDLARVESAMGRTSAGPARRDADERYRALGLIRPGDPAASADCATIDTLSDRERDVVGLLLEGLSYAQIARELFVSRPTVAFHLSNVYAKTNTANRHELVDLIRRTGVTLQ